MKIKVEFSKREKEVIAKAVGASLEHDFKEVEYCPMGSAVYDPNGTLNVEITTDFIEETVDIIDSFKDIITGLKMMLKPMVKVLESFKDKWFNKDEFIVETYDNDGNKIVKEFDENGKFVGYNKKEDTVDILKKEAAYAEEAFEE